MPNFLTTHPENALINTETKTALLRVMIEHPLRHFSLEELTQKSNLSPDTVIETIITLQNEGLRIKSYDPTHYFYDPNHSSLHPDVIAARLETQWWGRTISYFDEITSTIDYAKQLMDQRGIHGHLVLANYQSQGRGRQGNPWISQKGKDILLTFLLKLTEWEPTPSLLSLYAATAVARVLDTAYHLPVTIKWPNDLMIHNKKIGGVLVEKDLQTRTLLISLGFNVTSQANDWPQDQRPITTSLLEQRQEEWMRDLLIAQCGTTWEALWHSLLSDRGETLRAYWKKYSLTLGQRVSLRRLGQPMTGTTLGIDEAGRLIFRSDNGSTYHFLIEEVQNLIILNQQ